MSDNINRTGRTDGEGKVKFARVDSGLYNVTCTKDGFDTFSESHYFNVANPNFVIPTFYPSQFNVSCVVKDVGGNPVGGASVTIVQGSVSISGTTGSAGGCNLNGASKGTWELTVVKSGYATYTGSVVLSYPNNHIDVVLEEEAPTVDSVLFRVKDSSGASIDGAEVKIVGSETRTGTSLGGKVVFEDVPVGTYALTISKDDYYTIEEASILIDEDHTVFDRVLNLQSVDIHVRDSVTSSAIPLAEVTITDGTVTFTQTADATGSAVFGNVPVGSYDLTINHTGYTELTDTLTIDIEHMSFYKDLTPSVAFVDVIAHVTDEDTGDPIEGALVGLNYESRSATTDATGTATITNIPVGTYNYSISKTDYVTKTGVVPISESFHEFDVTLEPSTEVIVPEVMIIVKDAVSGDYVDGANVNLTSATKTFDGTTTMGKLVFNNTVVADTYQVKIVKDGYEAFVKPSQLISTELHDFVYEINPTGSATDVTFNVTDDNTHNPVVGAIIKLVQDSTVKYSGVTGSTGSCVINVVNGSYDVNVYAEGYDDSNEPSVLFDSEHTSHNVSIIPIAQQNITFTVTNTDNVPVSGARVYMTCGSNVKTGLTNDAGVASINNVLEDTWDISVVKTGYRIHTEQVTVDSSHTSFVVSLLEESTTSSFTIVVLDNNRRAVEGASVVLTDSAGVEHTGTSSNKGYVEVANAKFGTANLKITKTGYYNYEQAKPVTADTVTMEVVISEIEPTFDEGTVSVNYDGTPIAGAEVTVSDGIHIYNGNTEDDGVFRIDTMVVGTYTVTVRADDYETKTESSITFSGASPSHDMTLVPIGPSVSEVRLYVNNNYDDVANADVLLIDVNNVSHTDVTGTNGQLLLRDIPYGACKIKVSKEGHNTFYEEDISVNTPNTDLDIYLEPICIKGTVSCTEGPLSETTTCTLWDNAEPTVEYQVNTDDHGEYCFAGLKDGDYHLSVDSVDYNSSTVDSIIVSGSTVTQDVVLTPSVTYTITGTVTNEDGVALEGVSIKVGNTHTTVTDADGNYTYNVLPHYRYNVQLIHSSDNYEIKNTTLLVSRNTTQNIVLDFKICSISGIVTDTVGNIVPNAYVGGDWYWTTAGDDGKYYVTGFKKTKTYTIIAGADNHEDSYEEITIDADVVSYNPEIRALVPYKFTVKEADGSPIGYSELIISNDDTGYYNDFYTNDVGVWEWSLPDGNYNIEIRRAEYQDLTSHFVVDSSTTSATFVLTPETTKSNYTVWGNVTSENTHFGNIVDGEAQLLDSSEMAVYGSYVIDGKYSIPYVENGDYKLKVTVNGYKEQITTITVNNSNLKQDITMKIQNYGTWTGKTIDEKGVVVPNCEINIQNGEITTTSSSSGNFTLENIPLLTNFSIKITHPTGNYKTKECSNYYIGETPFSQNITLERVKLHMQGLIYDTDGNELEGVSVTAQGLVPVTSNGYGEYYMNPFLKGDTYEVKFHKEGYIDEVRTITFSTNVTEIITMTPYS